MSTLDSFLSDVSVRLALPKELHDRLTDLGNEHEQTVEQVMVSCLRYALAGSRPDRGGRTTGRPAVDSGNGNAATSEQRLTRLLRAKPAAPDPRERAVPAGPFSDPPNIDHWADEGG